MQLDYTVRTESGPISRDGVADAIDHRVGARGLDRVAEVAERQTTALREPSQVGVARGKLPAEVVAEDVVARADGERAGRGAGSG